MVQRGGGLSGESVGGGRRGVGSGAAAAGCPRRKQFAGVVEQEGV